jgi:hypothetical protein
VPCSPQSPRYQTAPKQTCEGALPAPRWLACMFGTNERNRQVNGDEGDETMGDDVRRTCAQNWPATALSSHPCRTCWARWSPRMSPWRGAWPSWRRTCASPSRTCWS